MLKRLRRKFTAMMMSVVFIILLIIFASMLYTTKRNLEAESLDMLRQALQGGVFTTGQTGASQNGDDRQSFRITVMMMTVAPNGETLLLSDKFSFIEDPAAVARLAAASPEEHGVLKEYGLRFLKGYAPGITAVALADTSVENQVIRTLVTSSLLVGSGALLAFFILSFLLARWAVGPVEEAWNRQRQFVADASHELKTPLTVILSNAEMLEGSGRLEDDGDRRRTENILAEGARMKRFVGDMLTLARADYVEEAKVFSPVSLGDAVMSGALLYESELYDDGKKLEYDVAENLEVYGDEGKLRQLVDILLDNAKKYTESGASIAVRLETSGKKGALLSVQSSGEPIPKNELESIFRRFYRIDKARVSHGGFGLGLSIARNIAEEHGGKIWAESGEGKGNVFYVWLPLKNASQ